MSLFEWTNYFVALFMICNPIGALPAMLNLTANDSPLERKKTGLLATFTIGGILIVTTWVGAPVLKGLGIGVPAFQVAGGVVIFLLALSMLKAETSRIKQTKEEKQEALEKEQVAITPLATPLIAGPGAISTILVKGSVYPDWTSLIFLTVAAIGVTFFLGLILYYSSHLEKLLGRVGINIFTRIGGLILAANAIESIVSGLKHMVPALN